MLWISFEDGIRGSYTKDELRKLYDETVDEGEFPDFDCWLLDMERSGIFIDMDYDKRGLRLAIRYVCHACGDLGFDGGCCCTSGCPVSKVYDAIEGNEVE